MTACPKPGYKGDGKISIRERFRICTNEDTRYGLPLLVRRSSSYSLMPVGRTQTNSCRWTPILITAVQLSQLADWRPALPIKNAAAAQAPPTCWTTSTWPPTTLPRTTGGHFSMLCLNSQTTAWTANVCQEIAVPGSTCFKLGTLLPCQTKTLANASDYFERLFGMSPEQQVAGETDHFRTGRTCGGQSEWNCGAIP